MAHGGWGVAIRLVLTASLRASVVCVWPGSVAAFRLVISRAATASRTSFPIHTLCLDPAEITPDQVWWNTSRDGCSGWPAAIRKLEREPFPRRKEGACGQGLGRTRACSIFLARGKALQASRK